MTIASETRKISYNGNGVTTVFAYPFRITNQAHLSVTKADAAGDETELVLTTDYTVSGVNSYSGGNVTLTTALPSGFVLAIESAVPYTQTTDIRNQGAFYPQIHEDAFDRITRLTQQNRDKADAALGPPATNDTIFDGRGMRITDIDTAEEAGDAVPLAQVEALLSGALGVSSATAPKVWTFTGDGVATAFQIASADVGNVLFYDVAIDGAVQVPTTDYTIALSGTPTITFNAAPGNGAKGLVILRGYAKGAADTAATLRADLASPTNGYGAYLSGYKRDEAYATARTVAAYLKDAIHIQDIGGNGDGLAANNTAFSTNAGTASVLVPAGTYRFTANTRIQAKLILLAGAVLKPDAGVVLTIDFPPDAPVAQIFDVAVGTQIVWSTNSEHRPEFIRPEWFGGCTSDATGATTGFRTCEIGINKAAASLATPGGIIQFTDGYYFCSGPCTFTDRIAIRGVNCLSSNLLASPAGWGVDGAGGNRLLIFNDSGTSAFDSYAEKLHIRGQNIAAITQLIYGPSWNERCGLRDCHVSEFMDTGVLVDNYYGGSANIGFERVTFFVSASATDATQIAIDLIDPGYAQGWCQVRLKEVVVAGNATNGTTNFFGIRAAGRIKVLCDAVHGEMAADIFNLAGAATVIGDSVQATGNATVVDIFDCGSTWTGRIHVAGVKKGGATGKVVFDRRASASAFVIGNDEPLYEPLVYPPAPQRAVYAGRFTGTATPAIVHAKGITGISRTSAGVYRLTMTSLGGAANYDVIVNHYHSAPLGWRVSRVSSTLFDVIFVDMAGVATDCDEFFVQVTHRES